MSEIVRFPNWCQTIAEMTYSPLYFFINPCYYKLAPSYTWILNVLVNNWLHSHQIFNARSAKIIIAFFHICNCIIFRDTHLWTHQMRTWWCHSNHRGSRNIFHRPYFKHLFYWSLQNTNCFSGSISIATGTLKKYKRLWGQVHGVSIHGCFLPSQEHKEIAVRI